MSGKHSKNTCGRWTWLISVLLTLWLRHDKLNFWTTYSSLTSIAVSSALIHFETLNWFKPCIHAATLLSVFMQVRLALLHCESGKIMTFDQTQRLETIADIYYWTAHGHASHKVAQSETSVLCSMSAAVWRHVKSPATVSIAIRCMA